MSKLVIKLYKTTRKANDVEMILSGNPKRIDKRAKISGQVKSYLKSYFKQEMLWIM